MSKLVTHFKHTLEMPVKIMKDGSEIEADRLIVNGPRPKDRDFALALESFFDSSFMDSLRKIPVSDEQRKEHNENKKKKGEKEDEIDYDTYMRLLSMAKLGHKDWQELFYYLKELLKEGNSENPQATLNGVKLTAHIYDEIRIRDQKSILGKYAYHFLSTALTK